MKLCRHCDTEKPDSEFTLDKAGKRRSWCHKCMTETSSNFGVTTSGQRVRLDEVGPYNQAIWVRELLINLQRGIRYG